jgi:hypothetical protein
MILLTDGNEQAEKGRVFRRSRNREGILKSLKTILWTKRYIGNFEFSKSLSKILGITYSSIYENS